MCLGEQEAWRRLSAANRLVLVTVAPDGRPAPVPITFAAFPDRQVVSAVDHKPKSTRELARLRHIRANPTVSLLADDWDEDWSKLWWVRATGTATVSRVRPAGADALEQRYPQYEHRPPEGPWIVVTVDRLTGWTAR